MSGWGVPFRGASGGGIIPGFGGYSQPSPVPFNKRLEFYIKEILTENFGVLQNNQNKKVELIVSGNQHPLHPTYTVKKKKFLGRRSTILDVTPLPTGFSVGYEDSDSNIRDMALSIATYLVEDENFAVNMKKYSK